MPLVDCPDCKKEISDKSECCVHCGYPIQNKNHLQQVEISKISVAAPKAMKRNAAVILTILVVFSISLWAYKDYRKFSVENEIRASYARILLNAVIQETIIDSTKEVWSNAIQSRYTDFNVALRLFLDKDAVKDVFKLINEGTEIIEKQHVFISSNAFFAGDLYKDYEVLLEKHKEISRFATVPRGSLQSYRNESRSLLNEFEKVSDKLSRKLEKTKGANTFFEWWQKQYLS